MCGTGKTGPHRTGGTIGRMKSAESRSHAAVNMTTTECHRGAPAAHRQIGSIPDLDIDQSRRLKALITQRSDHVMRRLLSSTEGRVWSSML